MRTQLEANVEVKGVLNNKVYHLVIIITDGNCHDMEETKKLLVEMSGMPFSAVIVGVGDTEFSDMEVLDADS